MSGRVYCPDCDGFGWIADGVCAGCEGRGTLTRSELRRLVLNPPIDFAEVIAAVSMFVFVVGGSLAAFLLVVGRAVA